MKVFHSIRMSLPIQKPMGQQSRPLASSVLLTPKEGAKARARVGRSWARVAFLIYQVWRFLLSGPVTPKVASTVTVPSTPHYPCLSRALAPKIRDRGTERPCFRMVRLACLAMGQQSRPLASSLRRSEGERE